MIPPEGEYYCSNGAAHQSKCCATCWNTHPKAKDYPNGEFVHSQEQRILAINYDRWIFLRDALKSGFTLKQVEFLAICFNMKETCGWNAYLKQYPLEPYKMPMLTIR